MASGKWVWMPDERPRGSGIVFWLLLIVVLFIFTGILTILNLGFLSLIYALREDDRRRKILAYIGSVIGMAYLYFDLENEWLSKYLFIPQNGNEAPLLGEQWQIRMLWANGISSGISFLLWSRAIARVNQENRLGQKNATSG